MEIVGLRLRLRGRRGVWDGRNGMKRWMYGWWNEWRWGRAGILGSYTNLNRE
jgi:hypothetical protein